jgi:hypothetical protein
MIRIREYSLKIGKNQVNSGKPPKPSIISKTCNS